MGKQGLGEMNENGEIFSDFCGMNNLVTGGTIFTNHAIHKITWRSPDFRTGNQWSHYKSVQMEKSFRGV